LFACLFVCLCVCVCVCVCAAPYCPHRLHARYFDANEVPRRSLHRDFRDSNMHVYIFRRRADGDHKFDHCTHKAQGSLL